MFARVPMLKNYTRVLLACGVMMHPGDCPIGIAESAFIAACFLDGVCAEQIVREMVVQGSHHLSNLTHTTI